ncbi:Protein-methionine-sulfoxide reductase heme-binding subunit MsrQ [hydrothermal vent metagenome]|uniref:Protein-methionine-sulfoxide reductase heme-binding subunit MsrQ n=1 Tax=hydrothermal vent metagenome TaxID=652676 RepID=A0A3B0S006_9ZZZZ
MRKFKPLVFVVLALPLLWLLWQWGLLFTGKPSALGANPIEATNRFLGDTALRVLLLTLAITPLRDILKWPKLTQMRRMIGLWAFFYVSLHLSSYFGMDLLFSLKALLKDISKRTYITLGMTAFVLLIPLAVTSTNGMIRRLGPKNWARLHKLIYLIAGLGVFHHFMMTKGNQLAPWVHFWILLILLGWRLGKRLKMGK